MQSKVTTPISTPNKESGNPFLSFASINDAIAQVGSATRAAAAPVVDAVSNVIGSRTATANLPSPPRRPPQRAGSRSSSKVRYSHAPGNGSFVFASNPQANGGLQNALKSVEGTFQRQISIGVLGNATDDFDSDRRQAIDRQLKLSHDSIAVWVPDAEFTVSSPQ